MAQSNSTSKPIQLFYSYSHQDEKLRDELEKHLSPLKWQGIISGWYDRRIGAGTEWSKEIERYLEESQVILLLISADFLASDYCYGREMRRALEKHATGEARVIPILLRPVDWSTTPLAQLQAVPQDAKPVTTWSNRDTAWASVAKSIRLVCEEVQKDYFMNFSKSDSIKNNSVETSQSIKYSSSTKNKNIIKYFTYISDTKLDMFWTQ